MLFRRKVGDVDTIAGDIGGSGGRPFQDGLARRRIVRAFQTSRSFHGCLACAGSVERKPLGGNRLRGGFVSRPENGNRPGFWRFGAGFVHGGDGEPIGNVGSVPGVEGESASADAATRIRNQLSVGGRAVPVRHFRSAFRDAILAHDAHLAVHDAVDHDLGVLEEAVAKRIP